MMNKKHTLYTEISLYMTGFAIIAAIMFTVLIINFRDQGFDDSLELLLMLEARQFEQEYRNNKLTDLPHSSTIKSYLNDWNKVPEYYQEHINIKDFEVGEFKIIDNSMDEDNRFLIIYPYRLFDGNILYLLADIQEDLLTENEINESYYIYDGALYPAGLFVFGMILMIWLLNRRYTRQINHLSIWANQISLENYSDQMPDFQYGELFQIAEKLQSAFIRYARITEKERQFLRNASHELRTPIAIIRANIELLEHQGISDEYKNQFSRISRAGQNMQLVTETLLWLSRENESNPQFTNVSLTKLIEESINDYHYLLDGKEITLVRDYSQNDQTIYAPVTPLQIIISNLLRNAFQHTQEGEIRVQIKQSSLIIKNDIENSDIKNTDDNFGLGLMLVSQVCERLQWSLDIKVNNNKACATLDLKFSP